MNIKLPVITKHDLTALENTVPQITDERLLVLIKKTQRHWDAKQHGFIGWGIANTILTNELNTRSLRTIEKE